MEGRLVTFRERLLTARMHFPYVRQGGPPGFLCQPPRSGGSVGDIQRPDDNPGQRIKRADWVPLSSVIGSGHSASRWKTAAECPINALVLKTDPARFTSEARSPSPRSMCQCARSSSSSTLVFA
jgi:hypothetical protein